MCYSRWWLSSWATDRMKFDSAKVKCSVKKWSWIKHCKTPAKRERTCRNVIEQRRAEWSSTDSPALARLSFGAMDCGYFCISVGWSRSADCSRAEWTVTNGCCRVESYCQGMKHIVVEEHMKHFTPLLEVSTQWKQRQLKPDTCTHTHTHTHCTLADSYACVAHIAYTYTV